MKTRNLLLALGCTAMLTACTNNDEPAVAPAMRTVTLSVEVAEPADTRVEYTEEGTTYKFAWSAWDELRVFYNDGTDETYTDFTIDEINGKQATFTGTLPASLTKVTIGYSARGFVSSGNKATIVGTDDADVLTALARNTYLYAENVSVTGGEGVTLPNVQLQHAAAYLLLKAGLQVVDGSVDQDYNFVIPEYTEPWYDLAFSSEGIEKTRKINIVDLHSYVDSDTGKLTKDVLVPFYVAAGGETLSLPFTILNSDYDAGIGGATQPAHLYKPGVIYEVAADDTNWVAAKLSE